MTIGQAPASSGAVTIWLLRRLDLAKPEQYELDLIEMGRVAQRFCLLAVQARLGVFLTPAVCDAKSYSALGVEQAANVTAYVLALGAPR